MIILSAYNPNSPFPKIREEKNSRIISKDQKARCIESKILHSSQQFGKSKVGYITISHDNFHHSISKTY